MSCTSLLSLALSAHAWMYDATIVLPALFYAMAKLAEPWRTRLVIAAYLLAALWMPIDAAIGFNPLAIITLGGERSYAPWRSTTKRSGRDLQPEPRYVNRCTPESAGSSALFGCCSA